MITYEDFTKLELRSGKVLEASAHPNADKLLVLKVDLGDKQIQLVAGIRATYTPEAILGKTVVVLVNLEPRALRGVESQGMVLAATTAEGIKVLTIDGEASAGCPIK
jgi:methionyl-tRNA synthetase